MIRKLKAAFFLPFVFAFEFLKTSLLCIFHFTAENLARFGPMPSRFSAVSNVSDLFVPEVAMYYASQRFTQSLGLMQELMGPAGSGAPIEIMDNLLMGFGNQGQYVQRPVFKRIGSSLVARRDITSNADTTPVNMTGDNEIAVKCNRRIGPLDFTADAVELTRATPEEFSAEFGKQVGEEVALNLQTSIISAAVGIIGGVTASANTNSVWSATVRTNLSPSVLNSTLELMGDERERFRSQARLLTRSECLTDMISDATGRAYSGMGDLALQGDTSRNTYGLGKPVTVDAAALTVADAGFDKYLALILGAGFIQVWFSKPLHFYNPFQTTLPEQVLNRWRGDLDFIIGTHGAKWDTLNGGANPTDAALATTTNWDANFSRHQEVRGLLAVCNYSGN